MGRREQARRDAAFDRGALGVDGQATLEAKPKEETEKERAREQLLRGGTFLGRELLTWLLWRSESSEPIADLDGVAIELVMAGPIVLRGVHGEVTELSAKGGLSPYSEVVRFALDRGLLVHRVRARITLGERQFEATLDAEALDVKSAALPELLAEEEDDRVEERLFLVEQLCHIIDALVRAFIDVRASRRWSATVGELKAWMRGDTGQRDKRRRLA